MARNAGEREGDEGLRWEEKEPNETAGTRREIVEGSSGASPRYGVGSGDRRESCLRWEKFRGLLAA